MPELDNPSDRLTATLDTLRSDLERTPLADSMTVRRRGDQRTRRQAVGGAVAVCAVIAGAAGVYGGVGGPDRATQVPATGGPTASTSVETPLDLAADPLLPADSPLLTIGNGTYQRAPGAPDVTQTKLQCMPDPTTLGATVTKAALFYSDIDGTFTEHALQFATSDQATAAAATLEQAFESCPDGDPAEVTTSDRGPEAVGLDGFHASRESVPTADAGIGYNEIGVAQDRNLLVVLYFNGMGNPVEDEASSPASAWVFDAERVTAAINAATA
jgi:hypothetical protein